MYKYLVREKDIQNFCKGHSDLNIQYALDLLKEENIDIAYTQIQELIVRLISTPNVFNSPRFYSIIYYKIYIAIALSYVTTLEMRKFSSDYTEIMNLIRGIVKSLFTIINDFLTKGVASSEIYRILCLLRHRYDCHPAQLITPSVHDLKTAVWRDSSFLMYASYTPFPGPLLPPPPFLRCWRTNAFASTPILVSDIEITRGDNNLL